MRKGKHYIKSNQFKLVITVRFWPTCNTIKLSDAITFSYQTTI